MCYVIGFISEGGLLGRTWKANSMSESKQVLRHIAEENQDIQLTEELIERFECVHSKNFVRSLFCWRSRGLGTRRTFRTGRAR
jgi:hypothetical protein